MSSKFNNTHKEALLDSAGNKVPSVSTILRKFQDPGALLKWAWKMGAEGKSLQVAREEQATAGHASAARAMALLGGEPFAEQAFAREVVIATERPIDAFTRWMQKSEARIVALNQPMVNERHGYGGLVTTATVDGVPVVLSLKAGKGVYLEDVLTAAAYLGLSGTAADALIIRFGKDSGGFDECRAFNFSELGPAWGLFLRLLDAYKSLKPVEALLLKGAA